MSFLKNIKTADDLLQEARLARRTVLRTARDNYIRQPINGFQVARPEDREVIKDTIDDWQILGVDSIEWILADNTIRTVTQSDLEEVRTQYAFRKLAAFSRFNELCDELMTATDPESIEWDLV